MLHHHYSSALTTEHICIVPANVPLLLTKHLQVSWRQGSSVKSIEDDSVARRLLKECCAASPNDNESHYDTDTDSDCDEISSAAQSSSINK
jgi:hypothetical protein